MIKHLPSASCQHTSRFPSKTISSELKFCTPLKILIVEDDIFNSKLAKAFIQKFGGLPTMAENGSVAVEICRQQTFDAILMDIRMPVMDGFEATVLIKEKDQLNSDTPIIALTANAADSIEHQCFKIGMSSFLTKPIQIQDLFTTLNQLSKQKSLL